MFYAGLDIHSKRISVCVLSETGQVVRRTQVRTIEEMMRILEGLPDLFEALGSLLARQVHGGIWPWRRRLTADLETDEDQQPSQEPATVSLHMAVLSGGPGAPAVWLFVRQLFDGHEIDAQGQPQCSC